MAATVHWWVMALHAAGCVAWLCMASCDRSRPYRAEKAECRDRDLG